MKGIKKSTLEIADVVERCLDMSEYKIYTKDELSWRDRNAMETGRHALGDYVGINLMPVHLYVVKKDLPLRERLRNIFDRRGVLFLCKSPVPYGKPFVADEGGFAWTGLYIECHDDDRDLANTIALTWTSQGDCYIAHIKKKEHV